MKKFILIIIFLFAVTGIILCFVFSMNSSDKTEDQIVDITTIALQSVFSGFVTFLGLYVTISFNEHQLKLKQRIMLRPVLYFEPTEAASALSEDCRKMDSIKCTYSKSCRTILCMLGNSNSSEVRNICIKKRPNISNRVKFDNEKKNTYVLMLNGKTYVFNSFLILYEDIVGNKYRQRIQYKYDKKQKTYVFKSFEPRRRYI